MSYRLHSKYNYASFSVPLVFSALLVPCFLVAAFWSKMLQPAANEKQRTLAHSSTIVFRSSRLYASYLAGIAAELASHSSRTWGSSRTSCKMAEWRFSDGLITRILRMLLVISSTLSIKAYTYTRKIVLIIHSQASSYSQRNNAHSITCITLSCHLNTQ